MGNIYGVNFEDNGKIYNFIAKDFTCPLNVTVIVDTENGQAFGKVVSVIEDNKIEKSKLKEIIRIANKKDYNQYLNNQKEAKEALLVARKYAKELKLDMMFISSTLSFDRRVLTINFVADSRIDFRELVKALAGDFHHRIELHQVGARDKAKVVGGIGMCGHELCCKRFLNKPQQVSINMAKNQDIALNPNKINGCCGRLLCCLSYENDEYVKCSYGMPQVGSFIKTPKGKGQVIAIDILNRKYIANVENEQIEFELDNHENN